eukprot:5929889-Pyramimonas_sp.AAC.1
MPQLRPPRVLRPYHASLLYVLTVTHRAGRLGCPGKALGAPESPPSLPGAPRTVGNAWGALGGPW